MKPFNTLDFNQGGAMVTTRAQASAQRVTAAVLAAALVVTMLVGLFPASAEAVAVGHTITAVSQSVLLNSGATTVAVPITVNADSNRKVASVAFSLDYNPACLQYTATDFGGVSTDFEKTVTNDNGDIDGELDIAIFDQDSPKASIVVNSTLVTVTFTLLPACQVDGVTPVNFSTAPAPSLGNPGGSSIPVTPVNGTVTIDWNRTATSITLAPFMINENEPVNTVVGTLASNDPDTDDPARVLTLVSGTGATDNALFTLSSITPAGATLSANPSFNFEVKKDYSVRVQVNDGKGGVYEQVIAITVVDVNEAPTALALDQTAVVEDEPAGTLVATVSVTDPDNADAYSTPDTFTMAFSGADATYFVFDGLQIKVAPGGLPSAETKSSYSFDVVITDNAGGVYGSSKTYTQTITISVVNHSELRIRTATVSRPPLWTTMGSTLQVPVNFLAKGNAVRSSSFQVTFDSNCFSFAGVTGPSAGGSATGGVATITGAAGSNYSDGDIFTLTFNANGACTTSDNLTNPIYSLQLTAAAVANASSSPLPVYRFDGQAYVIPNDNRGDCNSDGAIDAADFTAIALEIFDDADSASADDGYWLNAWNVYGAESLFRGSPRGCDASPVNDTALVVSKIQIADLLCTVNVVFEDPTCTTLSTARSLQTPAPATLTVSNAAGDGNTVDVTLNLASSNSAAGAAFSLAYDPAQLAIDPTDANQDGIPDAIVIHGPADYLKLAQVSFAGDQVDFALVDTTAPLNAIGDGVLATVRFNKIGAGEPKVTVTNLSVGDGAAVTLPSSVEYGQGLGQAIRHLFLPTVVR